MGLDFEHNLNYRQQAVYHEISNAYWASQHSRRAYETYGCYGSETQPPLYNPKELFLKDVPESGLSVREKTTSTCQSPMDRGTKRGDHVPVHPDSDNRTGQGHECTDRQSPMPRWLHETSMSSPWNNIAGTYPSSLSRNGYGHSRSSRSMSDGSSNSAIWGSSSA